MLAAQNQIAFIVRPNRLHKSTGLDPPILGLSDIYKHLYCARQVKENYWASEVFRHGAQNVNNILCTKVIFGHTFVCADDCPLLYIGIAGAVRAVWIG